MFFFFLFPTCYFLQILWRSKLLPEFSSYVWILYFVIANSYALHSINLLILFVVQFLYTEQPWPPTTALAFSCSSITYKLSYFFVVLLTLICFKLFKKMYKGWMKYLKRFPAIKRLINKCYFPSKILLFSFTYHKI